MLAIRMSFKQRFFFMYKKSHAILMSTGKTDSSPDSNIVFKWLYLLQYREVIHQSLPEITALCMWDSRLWTSPAVFTGIFSVCHKCRLVCMSTSMRRSKNSVTKLFLHEKFRTVHCYLCFTVKVLKWFICHNLNFVCIQFD